MRDVAPSASSETTTTPGTTTETTTTRTNGRTTNKQQMDHDAMRGWFSETNDLWPNQATSLRVEDVLFASQSEYQDVMVFRNASYGNVLVLDGVIQATERDEFAYQEMIAHLPLCALSESPKRVLVVGGGDGGVLREVARHGDVERIEIAEIDAMVVETARRYLPKMAAGFDDERVEVNICDGIKYVGDAEEGTYDAIIVDSSDPIGPASALFEEAFFEKLHRALKPGGALCAQAECLWLHVNLITELAKTCKRIFAGGSIEYGYTTTPTYPSGQIGFILCGKPASDGSTVDFRNPKRAPKTAEGRSMEPLKYYNADIHRAAFVLPEFARAALEPHIVKGSK